eukprot:s2413_g2.t1
MAVALVLPDAEPSTPKLQEDLDSDFQLPAYLEELLHELDVSQPLLRAEPLSFKVETFEEGEAEFHQESPADADVKEPKEQDDTEAVAAVAAAAAVRAAKLAEFADKAFLGKRKKQQHRKARFPTGPIFEPQILWKPDANGGRPVPKREDLRAALTYQESGTAPRPSTVPTPRGPRRGPRRRTGRKQEQAARTLMESPTFPFPNSRPQTTGTLPGLEVHGLEVVTGDSKVHGELVISPRPPSAERRSSTPDRASARLVECPMLVTAMPGPCRSPQQKPRYVAQRHSFGPSNTLESLASPVESVADDDFDRQISPHPGYQFGVALRHPQLLLPMPGSPKGDSGLSHRSVPPVRDFNLEPEELIFATQRSGAAEGGSGRHAATSFEVQLPRLQRQGTTVTDTSSCNVSQELHSEGSQAFGLEWPNEDSQLLGPLASSPSAGSRDPAFAVDEGEFKDRVSTGSTEKGPPDLDKDEKLEAQRREPAVAESHHQDSQHLPIWQEANVSYHSMLEGLGPRRLSGQVEPETSELPGREDTLEFEPLREEEVQLAYLVPPWSLREHLHLDSERYLPRDDTPMDPEVCAILKGLERAPALQSSRPSSRASPTRPGSANRFCASDFDSLVPSVHAPRGLFTAGGHRRRHLVTPSPTLSNPESPARARTQTPTRPEGSRPGYHAALGTSMLCLMHPSRTAVKAQIASQCMALLNAGRLQSKRRPRTRAGTATMASPQQEEPEPERPATPESWKYSGGSQEDAAEDLDSPPQRGRDDLAHPSFSEEIFD